MTAAIEIPKIKKLKIRPSKVTGFKQGVETGACIRKEPVTGECIDYGQGGFENTGFLECLAKGPLSRDESYLLGYDTRQIIAELKKGFQFRIFEETAESLRVALDELRTPIGILTRRTLDRRKQEGRLKFEESERLYRIIKIFYRSLEVFKGNKESVRTWMTRPALGLGGESPLKHAETEVGANAVLNLLWGMEHGDII